MLNDENGKQVANLLVTNCTNISQHGVLRPARCVYRKDPECSPDCVMMTKPNDRAPTKRADASQSNAPQPNSKASEVQRLN